MLYYLEQYRARQLTVETLVTRQAAVGHTLLIILSPQSSFICDSFEIGRPEILSSTFRYLQLLRPGVGRGSVGSAGAAVLEGSGSMPGGLGSEIRSIVDSNDDMKMKYVVKHKSAKLL